MSLKEMNIRPVQKRDVEQLDLFRRSFTDGWLELPHGLAGTGVETAVAEKQGKLVGSLTGISAVLFDPYIHDPEASGSDVFAAVLALERTLAYNAQAGGAIDAYIAIPQQSEDYIRMVERCGYTRTCEGCVILRRALVPDTVSLLEDEAKPQ